MLCPIRSLSLSSHLSKMATLRREDTEAWGGGASENLLFHTPFEILRMTLHDPEFLLQQTRVPLQKHCLHVCLGISHYNVLMSVQHKVHRGTILFDGDSIHR